MSVNKVGSAWVKRISLEVFLFTRTLGRCTAHILVSLPLVVVEVGARYRRRSDVRVLFAAEEVEALHRLFEEAVEEASGLLWASRRGSSQLLLVVMFSPEFFACKPPAVVV